MQGKMPALHITKATQSGGFFFFCSLLFIRPLSFILLSSLELQ